MQLMNSFMRKILICLSAVMILGVSFAVFAQDSTPKPSGTTTATPANSTPAPRVIDHSGEDKSKPSLPPGIDMKTGTPLYETIQEDWSSLAIGTSHLEPEQPLVASVDDHHDTFVRTLVQVKWRPGDPLDLWIVTPKGVTKPPVVLYLYSYDQDTDRFRSDGWAARVTSGGVAAVGFVSALTGHRFHDRPMKQWYVSELQEAVGSTVHDVKFILDYLAQRGDLDMNRVGMFGEGSGGTVAILAAAADPRIKVVDTIEPWGDWPDFLSKSALVQLDPNHAEYVKPEFLKKVAPLDPVKWMPDLKVPIRIQQVHQGNVTPIEVKTAIKAAAPKQGEIVRFETDREMGEKEGQGRLFEWIKIELHNIHTTPAGNVSVADKSATAPSGNAQKALHQ
jgi:X-Pro dipeptidyl-peptidase (S15 family)